MPSSLGPAEILVILVVALIVLGPKRLPEAGRQVGKAFSEVRRWSQDVKYEMTQAFEAEKAPPPMPPMTSSPPAEAAPPPPVDAGPAPPADAAPEPKAQSEAEPPPPAS